MIESVCRPGSILGSERTGTEERCERSAAGGRLQALGVGGGEGRGGKADTGGCSEGPASRWLCLREGLRRRGEERKRIGST